MKELVCSKKTVGVVLLVMLLWGSTAYANNVNPVGSEDLYAEIIDFVVGRDPVLDAQREVIQAARALDSMQDTDEAFPSYAQGSLMRMRFEAVSGVREAQHQYSEIERQLVSALFANLTRIFSLRNQVENNQYLLAMLEERRGPTERQAEAGIIPMDALWDLSDRIVSVRISIADAEATLSALERETAYNFGGDQWAQLLDMIQRLR